METHFKNWLNKYGDEYTDLERSKLLEDFENKITTNDELNQLLDIFKKYE